jgi:hypothetical protein
MTDPRPLLRDLTLALLLQAAVGVAFVAGVGPPNEPRPGARSACGGDALAERAADESAARRPRGGDIGQSAGAAAGRPALGPCLPRLTA